MCEMMRSAVPAQISRLSSPSIRLLTTDIGVQFRTAIWDAMFETSDFAAGPIPPRDSTINGQNTIPLAFRWSSYRSRFSVSYLFAAMSGSPVNGVPDLKGEVRPTSMQRAFPPLQAGI